MIVADYKIQSWRQSDRSLSGDAAASKRRVEDAEQALVVSDRTAKHAEQRLALELSREPSPSRAERQALQGEARRTMDAAAECAEKLVALRKLEEVASLSHSGAEEVHQRSADRLLALARTNKGAYLKIAQHLSQAAPTAHATLHPPPPHVRLASHSSSILVWLFGAGLYCVPHRQPP